MVNLIDQLNSLVIDVTFNCNAKCAYCQWGSKHTEGRVNQPNEFIYLTEDNLNALDTERIVFSGGEPLLRQDLEEIIAYYKKTRVQSIVVVTNGFLLSPKRLKSLINAGLTGVTFSIDSFDKVIAQKTRGYTEQQLSVVMKHFEHAVSVKDKSTLELSVNVVISTANLENNGIEQLIAFTNNYSIDWIKFQPIFDDGYVGKNAPYLLLNKENSDMIYQVGIKVTEKSKNETNPITFWKSLSQVLNGKKLLSNSCGLDTRQTIAQKGSIKICSWIDYPQFNLLSNSTDCITDIQSQFLDVKKNCETGTFCYCLQKLNHSWETQ